MATEAQNESNRANAALSTGPKSVEGKRRCALNSLRHGLRSECILIPGESQEEFREFAQALRRRLEPVGAVEELHVERIVCCAWRLRRVVGLEREMLLCGKASVDQLHNMDFCDADRVVRENALGKAFEKGQNAFAVLMRYEASLSRALHRGLNELERIQRLRGGEPKRVRVLRGGSWNNQPGNCRSANRGNNTPGNRNSNNGFRAALHFLASRSGRVPGIARFTDLASVAGKSWLRSRATGRRRVV